MPEFFSKGQCSFCHKKDQDLVETRDGWHICGSCAEKVNFCEICGSITTPRQTKDEQLHFEEECFK